ncbi:MAG: thioether cross-link-forming SCIFF peptide maturase [Clostridiaceae bacterium]|nr:thioether cross-link-forming SCIFF peptide maturase [Clostridiaceae bacterium]
MIHTFALNNMYFAVDGNSGSIHMLDELSFRLLSEMQELVPLESVIGIIRDKEKNGASFSGNPDVKPIAAYSYEEIEEAYNEIKELKEQGLLFTGPQEIEKAVSVNNLPDSIKALCLHVSHDCNLTCEYCFASKGDYKSGRKLMDKDIAFKAVDYLVNNSGNRKNIEIDFFGGEPLLNFTVVKEVVDYGRELENKTGKKFYFTITTNGVLLDDEKIRFINEYMDNVVISIDGRKEIHDSIRRDRSGRGTYDRIVPLVKKLVHDREGKSYYIRGTFTSLNKDFSNDVKHLASLGFREISIEPVVGSGNELFIKDEDVPDILSEYEKFAVEYAKSHREENSFNFYHFNLNLYDGPCIYKKIAACGAGFEYFAVSPEGYLYPCHQFVGQNEFIMGDIFNGINKTKMADNFRQNNILTKEKCKDCWAKLFCSGGCHANAWYSYGDIALPNETACTLQKKRIECAIMIQAAKSISGI